MIKTSRLLLACAALGALMIGAPSFASQSQDITKSTADPVAPTKMSGLPPAPGAVVNRANILRPENSRWAFRNLRQIYPTRSVPRADKTDALPIGPTRNLERVELAAEDGEKMTLAEWQRRTHTDALIVMRDGRIVYQQYAPGMTGRTHHALWSMSKSVVGLVAMMAIDEGKLDPDRQINSYLPELKGSGWDGATLRDALDMRVGIAYRETFADPTAEIFKYLFAAGLLVPPKDFPVAQNMYEYLATIQGSKNHGGAFSYMSADTEVVSWILQRVYGDRLASIVSNQIWSKIGAQDEAYYLVDPFGIDIGSVGLAATPFDLARLGQALANSAKGKKAIIARSSLDALRSGVTRDAFAQSNQASVRAGYSYRNQWWVPHDADGTMEAKGLYGQHLVINPEQDIVIVKLSTNPTGETILTHKLDKAAFAAIFKAIGE
jgi:CubicO group peptidase (beta-lactamase class C family)